MTYNLLKSRLNLPEEDVNLLVKAHAEELEQWTENMRLYEEEQKTPPPEEPVRDQFESDDAYTQAYIEHHEMLSHRRQPYPAPLAHPEIDAAVSRSERDGQSFFIPDFHFVDDTVPKAETNELEQLKEVYFSQVQRAEADAYTLLMAPGKIRINSLRVLDVMEEDKKQMNLLASEINALVPQLVPLQEKFLKGEPLTPKEDQTRTDLLAQNEGLQAQLADPGFVRTKRSAEDNEFMDWIEGVEIQRTHISRQVAQMQSDIEDLTEDNVRSWTLGSFK